MGEVGFNKKIGMTLDNLKSRVYTSYNRIQPLLKGLYYDRGIE